MTTRTPPHLAGHDDHLALKRVARAAEKAGFDFLFLDDWLSTDLEFSDPHLLSGPTR